jgi:bifunctional UDP-N-acetylglucosamine pyrophosphorylase/glucosamine-1-phosphate N-acetyltransferase
MASPPSKTDTAIILAAGLGTRMKSAQPKAMHPIAGRPMLCHLLETVQNVFTRIAVVIGPDMQPLADLAAPHPTAIQTDRLGTAHAALAAEKYFGAGEVVILFADNPLIRPETLRNLVTQRQASNAGLALMAMLPQDPARYGRLIVENGQITRIVEWADATKAERELPLCNGGALCGPAPKILAWLRAIRPDNAKGEYYLTDLVRLANEAGERVIGVQADEAELRGINSRAELAQAEAAVQTRLRQAAMDNGVTLIAPETVFFAYDTAIGPDTVVHPNVVFGPGVTIEGPAEIRAFSHLEGCRVAPGAIIGPYARLRPGTQIGHSAHVGNFVELKATKLGDGAKVNHLTYLGDATIGAKTNIGAGSITCNYDGYAKHRTEIGDGVFVGSDSVLIAPVTLGDGAFIAAGSVITKNVTPNAMAFGRARQAEIPGAAAKFRAARKEKK